MIYRCPVCGGRGLVPAGFYNIGVFGGGSTTATSETCRACGGSGLVADC
jgi:rRNA maturation protein Nop10